MPTAACSTNAVWLVPPSAVRTRKKHTVKYGKMSKQRLMHKKQGLGIETEGWGRDSNKGDLY
jgi:hypothetical protein